MEEQKKVINVKLLKEKKPFYKKLWFWVIIVFCLIIVTTCSSSNNNQENKESNEKYNDWYDSGTYKVGVDIAAGEYLVEKTKAVCYIEVNKDSSGTFDSIVSNENVYTRTYITLLDGQYFTIKGGKFIEVSKINNKQPDEQPDDPIDKKVYKEGMYKVGVDIEPGEYKITSNDSHCYIEVAKDSLNVLGSIVSNENIYLNETYYITVISGQYLTVRGGVFEKVN